MVCTLNTSCFSLLLAENVPVELRDPFYCDQYEQEHLKPPVTRLLLSPELYCRAYGLLLGGSPGAEGPPKDIPALLQVLGRKGLAPKDQNAPVTEAELQQKPIKMVRRMSGVSTFLSELCAELRFIKQKCGVDTVAFVSQNPELTCCLLSNRISASSALMCTTLISFRL